MLLREVLARGNLRLRLLTGTEPLDKPVSRVFVTDLPDPRRYLIGGEIVLTGIVWRRTPADAETFVAACAAAGVTAIGAGDAAFGCVPHDLVDAARAYGVALFEVPVEVSFRDIVEAVSGAHWARRTDRLASALSRQRGFVTAIAEGARLADLLPTVVAGRGADCWVLSLAGDLIAGTTEMAPAVRHQLIGAFMVAERLPVSIQPESRPMMMAVVPGRPEHRLAAWLLVCAPADPDRPVPDDLMTELVSLVALERARADAAADLERRLTDQVGRMLTGGGDGDAMDVRARLRACGLEPAGPVRVFAARMTGLPTPVELTAAILRDVVTAMGRQAAVTISTTDGWAGIVLAVVGTSAGATPPEDEVTMLCEILRRYRGGLGKGRLAVGVSGPVTDVVALPGAAREAAYALRSAEASDQAPVVSASDIASHDVLLAGMPSGARDAFRNRMLGPLDAYDRARGGALLPTLAVFLENSGAWGRCAELLHVHVNTLRYRIGRIEQLTGRDLGRFADRVDFFLALQMDGPRR